MPGDAGPRRGVYLGTSMTQSEAIGSDDTEASHDATKVGNLSLHSVPPPLERKTSIVQIPLNGSCRSFVIEEKSEIENNVELKKMLQQALLNATRGSFGTDLDDEQEECPICYEEIEGNDGFLTSCQPRAHKYHYICMFRYLRFSSVYKCPFCNSDITHITPLSSHNKLTKEQLIELLMSGPTDISFVHPMFFASKEDAVPLSRQVTPAPSSDGGSQDGRAGPTTPTPAAKRPAVILQEVVQLPATFMDGYQAGGTDPPSFEGTKGCLPQGLRAGEVAGDIALPEVVVQLVDKDREPIPCGVSYEVRCDVTCLNKKVKIVAGNTELVDKASGRFSFKNLLLRPVAEGFSYFDMSVTLEFQVVCSSEGDVELACDGAKLYGRMYFVKRTPKPAPKAVKKAPAPAKRNSQKRQPISTNQGKRTSGGCCGGFFS
eukprot:TRINITY_DN1080_c2_g1_i2.p1 TRINITY_DN1080_c2_g1~~TRINITY_DN1080_c2_g1_i2.p1  ORF type:complete len:486 (+),score=149.54 TRINITY_DN1080_c2_g1_i2:167-1459(+)